MKNKTIPALLILLYASPFLILGYYFEFKIQVSFKTLADVLLKSIFQASISAALVICLALFIAKSYSSLKLKWQKWVDRLCLVPIMIPSLYTVLLMLFIFGASFPYGSLGIILTFVCIHFGYAAVLIKNSYTQKIMPFAKIEETYGISSLQSFLKIVLPLLKGDLLNVFMVVFLSCLTSLSVPMLVGGRQTSNLELYIYELIFKDGDWSSAAVLGLVQMFLVAILLLLFKRSEVKINFNSQNEVRFKLSGWPKIFLFGYLAVYFIFLLKLILKSILKMGFVINDSFQIAFLNSLGLFLVLTASTLIMQVLIFYVKTKTKFYPYLLYWFVPSTVVVGFAYYLFFPVYNKLGMDFLKLGLVFSIIYSLVFFKSYIEPSLDRIKNQLLVSEIYSLKFTEVVTRIVWPQVKGSVGLLIALVGLFSLSDFALIKAAGVQRPFMGTLILENLESYRTEQAYFLSGLVFIIWLFGYFVFRGMYVGYRKFKI